MTKKIYRFFLFEALKIFWKKNPALWVALVLSISLLTSFGCYSSLMAIIFILPFLTSKEKIYAVLVFMIVMCYTHLIYKVPDKSYTGKATVKISSYGTMKRGWSYKGNLLSFTSNNECVAKNIPCRIYSNEFYPPNFLYEIEGSLKCKKSRGYVTLSSDNEWHSIKEMRSFALFRFSLKSRIAGFLYEHIKTKKSAAFLISLITGDTQDDVQRYTFAKLGLAHLFAVSGFHFALFAFAFHFFLRLFFPKKVEALLLLFILTLFFLFIGCSPSVERAWFTALFTLFALIIEKEKRSLNTFGLALLCVLITNPYFINDLGFQLSFLATVGILLFYNVADFWLQKLFPKVPYHSLMEKNFFSQALYLITTLFRKSMALNLAVHLTLFPIMLATFHKFPLHSFIYNLFFPFLVSIDLMFLLFILPFSIIPFLGDFLFNAVNVYTSLILNITEFSLIPMHTWYVETLPPLFVPVSSILIFLFGIVFSYYLEKKERFGEFGFMFY